MMPMAAIDISGATLAADLSGALWWAEEKLLVFADLHLEKGSAYATKGQFLPPYDTAATLRRAAAVIERLGPETVVSLGDSFHDMGGPDRLDDGDAAALDGLTGRCDWVWIAGNHDPDLPEGVGGRVLEEYCVGPLAFRHEALVPTDPGEVSGHFHPKAAVRHRGKRLSGRCFVSDGHRLVLPAFGAYAGGLNVRDPAIAGLFPQGYTVWLIGRKRVYPFPAARLAG